MNEQMNETELQEYYLRCICNTSVDYARSYIPQATIETLRKCLEILRQRPQTTTLRLMITRRISRLERAAAEEGTDA